VTLTHTVGVLVLGLALSVSSALVPTAVEQVLAVMSGLLMVGVGIGLLVPALRRSRSAEPFAALVPAEGTGVDVVGQPVGVAVAASPTGPVHALVVSPDPPRTRRVGPAACSPTCPCSPHCSSSSAPASRCAP
jgi:hypothetical protein